MPAAFHVVYFWQIFFVYNQILARRRRVKLTGWPSDMYAALWYTSGTQPQVHLGYLTIYLQLRYNNGVCAGPFGPRGLGVEPPVVSGSKND